MVPAWQEAFGPHYNLGDTALALAGAGFHDESWRNDACPKFVRDDGVVVYADHHDPGKRIREPGSCLRYELVQPDSQGWMTAESPKFTTDSLSELLGFIKALHGPSTKR